MNLLVLLSRGRDLVALVVALIISLMMMNSSSHPSAERFRFGIGRVVSIVAGPLMFVPKTVTVWGENAELRAEVARLKGERDNWRDALLENIRLRKLLGLRDQPHFYYLAADVIARNPSVNMSSLLLNKGTRDSVKAGQAVITSEGLAGVIHHAGATSSIAQLGVDPNFAASVRVERSRVDGILRWYKGATFMLDGISKNQDVKPGDRIVTSGLGELIPAGLAVGVVTSAESSENDIFLNVRLKPYVHFARMEEVFVLMERAPIDSTEGEELQ